MTTMVRRALDQMLNPKPLPVDLALVTFRLMEDRDAEITRLRARIAELERERDGLLSLIL